MNAWDKLVCEKNGEVFVPNTDPLRHPKSFGIKQALDYVLKYYPDVLKSLKTKKAVKLAIAGLQPAMVVRK